MAALIERNIAAGIDHHGILGGFAPQQRAVLSEQRHRDDGGAGFRRLVVGRSLGSYAHNADFYGLAKRFNVIADATPSLARLRKSGYRFAIRVRARY